MSSLVTKNLEIAEVFNHRRWKVGISKLKSAKVLIADKWTLQLLERVGNISDGAWSYLESFETGKMMGFQQQKINVIKWHFSWIIPYCLYLHETKMVQQKIVSGVVGRHFCCQEHKPNELVMPCEVCQMHDLLSEGIALVECLDSPREARLVLWEFFIMGDAWRKNAGSSWKVHVTSTSWFQLVQVLFLASWSSRLMTTFDGIWDGIWMRLLDPMMNLPRLYHWMPCTSWPPAWRTWIGSWRPRKVGWGFFHPSSRGRDPNVPNKRGTVGF